MSIDLIAELSSRGHIIGNDRISETQGGVFDHVNGYTGQIQFQVPLASPTEVERAVAAARTAANNWRRYPLIERQRLLFRLADLLEMHAEEFGTITALETGVPIAQGPSWAAFAALWTRYYAGWVDKIEGQVVPVFPHSGFDYTLPEPYGVIAAIPPFNGPLGSMGQKVAPALAAGNTVVVKPPELSPFAVLRWGELALEAGFPPGVINVIPGSAAAGDALVRHPDLDKITFTGGGETARRILESAAKNLTPATLELGGKSANIVFPDADLDLSIPMSLDMSVIVFSGQVCLAPTRMYVHDDIYDEVLDRIRTYIDATIIGNPMDKATTMGHLISERQLDRVMQHIDRAKMEDSGSLFMGGERCSGDLSSGFFVAPTVFTDVDPESALATEEVFGPVLSIMRFQNESEVIEQANRTDYGLAAYVQTRDLARAHRVAAELNAGYVNVNGFAGLAPSMPFGGNKDSGYGREGGKQGLDEFLQIKNVYVTL